MIDHEDENPTGSGLPRLIGALFMIVPLGVGISVLVFVWGTPTDGLAFAFPMKLFASFVALGFLLVGLAGFLGVVQGKKAMRKLSRHSLGQRKQSGRSGGGYVCKNCGASLQAGADVSPAGDVKCSYCNTWFNIHQ